MNKIIIPEVRLAGPEEDALKRKREELKQRLLDGKKVMVGKHGSVTGSDGTPNIEIKGDVKLAVQQWYQKDPMLLAAEKAAMQHAFPHFLLDKLGDGRLCWVGSLNLGLGFRDWEVMAVYKNNHPQQEMGSSVQVFLVEPDIDELIEGLGERPHHLLRDNVSGLSYLCTARAQDVKASKTESTSAAQSIAMAVRWLMAFELVLSGNLSWEDFNKPGKI